MWSGKEGKVFIEEDMKLFRENGWHARPEKEEEDTPAANVARQQQ